MAHVAFVCPPFLGHLNPMAVLARALVGRGHRTTFLGMPELEPMAGRLGFEFRPIGPDFFPPGTLDAAARRLGRAETPLGLLAVIRDVARTTEALCRSLPDALRGLGADILVCDQAEAAGGLVAGHLGLPFVTVANALPLNREPTVPPPFLPWRYDPSEWGRERNRGGYRVADRLMRAQRRVIAEHAGRWRLGPKSDITDCLSPFAEIFQIVPALDFPREALPETVHACGPLRDPALAPPPVELPTPNGRPLVFATLGTLQGGRGRLFRVMAEAARRLDLRLLIAHGGRLPEAEALRLPGRPAVHAFVPQAEVLAASDLAIVNGGLNTVLDALAAGVPPLVVPIAFEQGAIAARVVRTGAGASASRRLLTAGRLARRLDALLNDRGAREAAGRLRAELAAAGGVGRAADVVEAVLATGRPVSRAAFAGAAFAGAAPSATRERAA